MTSYFVGSTVQARGNIGRVEKILGKAAWQDTLTTYYAVCFMQDQKLEIIPEPLMIEDFRLAATICVALAMPDAGDQTMSRWLP